jgi:hypothetical protein
MAYVGPDVVTGGLAAGFFGEFFLGDLFLAFLSFFCLGVGIAA